MLPSSRRSGSKLPARKQFDYLQPVTEEEFQREDIARYKRQEKDIKLGFKLREDVERERITRARNQATIDSTRRRFIRGDHTFEDLVQEAVCRNCGGLTDVIVWPTKVEAQDCCCNDPSDDEVLLPSPPQTPSRTTEITDGRVDDTNTQWLRERFLMELRGPYCAKFENYDCWRIAKNKRFATSTRLQHRANRIETISSRVRGLNR